MSPQNEQLYSTLLRADTLSAILNPNYFVELLTAIPSVSLVPRSPSSGKISRFSPASPPPTKSREEAAALLGRNTKK